MLNANGQRPWTFYLLAVFFVLYVLFLYGPMICIPTGKPAAVCPTGAAVAGK